MFALLLLVLALPAVANAPVITVTPFTPMFVQSLADGGNGCPSFDVLIVAQQGRPIRAKTITFANGSSVSSGAVFATATNQTPPTKSINLNISGPAQFSVSENTMTLFGPQLLVGLPCHL
jgi:hypothetical protein